MIDAEVVAAAPAKPLAVRPPPERVIVVVPAVPKRKAKRVRVRRQRNPASRSLLEVVVVVGALRLLDGLLGSRND